MELSLPAIDHYGESITVVVLTITNIIPSLPVSLTEPRTACPGLLQRILGVLTVNVFNEI